MKVRKSSVTLESGWRFGTSLCERGYVEEKAQTWLRSRRMLTVALLLAAALLGHPASATDKTESFLRTCGARRVAKIAKPTGSKLVKGPAESEKFVRWKAMKIAKKIANHRPS
jgi:hypothetical protein